MRGSKLIIERFITRVCEVYATGNATEHSYRSAIETLFHDLDAGVQALNEPKRAAYGAPDFNITRGEVTIGNVEAKDVPVDIRNLKDVNKNQRERYLKACPNLIYTNGLDFDFYRRGERIHSVSIGDFVMGIQPKPENFDFLETLLRDFVSQAPQSITSTRELAIRMAGKASIFKEILGNALKADADLNSDLSGQYKAFKQQLIHDITPEDFADIYAETIAYGLFAARLHDDTVSDFSRQEALERLPKTYPFLRDLFSYIAGPNLDETIRPDVDDLAAIFRACDLHKLVADFGKLTGQNDPFLHFYEVFLAEYNPAKRRARGVWYTPEPVVNFIVRAVDDVLQKEFGLPLGLADTSKVTIDVDTGVKDKKGKPIINREQVHRVQILDPATGTGTFLAEVIKQIAPKVKGMAEGVWSGYVEKDLIPRLHGFELLMASYAMCHMKLDMVLTELGYKPSEKPPRLSIYLTNSLEEGQKEVADLFMAQWLTREAREANAIKRDKPIMCVIGNPPYSVSSANKGKWITDLIADYKSGLNERKINLDDDYIKFLRFAHAMIEKNGSGVVGFITNNSFLDGVTHRRMREKILEDFSAVYVVDLHGSTKKKEVAPDGTADHNVFDIQQGVSITLLIKNQSPKRAHATVTHVDLWGKRATKYDYLSRTNLFDTDHQSVTPTAPYYFFKPKNWEATSEYEKGFPITSLFPERNSGIQTKRDKLNVAFSQADIEARLNDLMSMESEAFRARYALPKDGRDWSISMAKADVQADPPAVLKYNYRPFDTRFTPYNGNAKGIQAYPRTRTSNHLLEDDNFALCVCRQLSIDNYAHVFCTELITDLNSVSINSKEQTYFCPLYLYPADEELDQTRRVNFDEAICATIRKAAKDDAHGEPDEVAVFDYIYGVLHCPAYRETYAEFLKIDFPRVPYPPSPDVFWNVSAKGTKLRRLHLMEPEVIGETPYPYKGDGDDVVEKPNRDDEGRVWINKTQHFENVPKIAWELYIGGYQPAQKWLKDRKGRELSFDDIVHYQRIVKILSETDRIMKTIEMPIG